MAVAPHAHVAHHTHDGGRRQGPALPPEAVGSLAMGPAVWAAPEASAHGGSFALCVSDARTASPESGRARCFPIPPSSHLSRRVRASPELPEGTRGHGGSPGRRLHALSPAASGSFSGAQHASHAHCPGTGERLCRAAPGHAPAPATDPLAPATASSSPEWAHTAPWWPRGPPAAPLPSTEARLGCTRRLSVHMSLHVSLCPSGVSDGSSCSYRPRPRPGDGHVGVVALPLRDSPACGLLSIHTSKLGHGP